MDRILAANLDTPEWNLKHLKYQLWGPFAPQMKLLPTLPDREKAELINTIIDSSFSTPKSRERMRAALLDKLNLREVSNRWLKDSKNIPNKKLREQIPPATSNFIAQREPWEEIQHDPRTQTTLKPEQAWKKKKNTAWNTASPQQREQIIGEIIQKYKSKALGGGGIASSQLSQQYQIPPLILNKILKERGFALRTLSQQREEDWYDNPALKQQWDAEQAAKREEKLRKMREYTRNWLKQNPDYYKQWRQNRQQPVEQPQPIMAANWFKRLLAAAA